MLLDDRLPHDESFRSGYYRELVSLEKMKKYAGNLSRLSRMTSLRRWIYLKTTDTPVSRRCGTSRASARLSDRCLRNRRVSSKFINCISTRQSSRNRVTLIWTLPATRIEVESKKSRDKFASVWRGQNAHDAVFLHPKSKHTWTVGDHNW